MVHRFPGLAIGGPLDGKLVEDEHPQFVAVIRTPKFVVGQAAGNVDFWDYKPYTYRHVPTEYGVHFWFGEDVTNAIAMTRLALIYSKAANAVSG